MAAVSRKPPRPRVSRHDFEKHHILYPAIGSIRRPEYGASALLTRDLTLSSMARVTTDFEVSYIETVLDLHPFEGDLLRLKPRKIELRCLM
jgi:hypothetical protein